MNLMIGTKKQKMQKQTRRMSIFCFIIKQKCILVNFARFYEEKYDDQYLINIDFSNLLMTTRIQLVLDLVTQIHSILVLFDSFFLMICMNKVVTDSFVPA